MRTQLFSYALSLHGVRELPGIQNNALVVQMLRKLLPWANRDEINWCSAFVAYVAERTGYKHEKATAAARSWQHVGEQTDAPVPGDVAVFWRNSPTDWRGHVGFYVAETEAHVAVLGGNQGNAVRISYYPKSRLLGYRKLIKQHPPQT